MADFDDQCVDPSLFYDDAAGVCGDTADPSSAWMTSVDSVLPTPIAEVSPAPLLDSTTGLAEASDPPNVFDRCLPDPQQVARRMYESTIQTMDMTDGILCLPSTGPFGVLDMTVQIGKNAYCDDDARQGRKDHITQLYERYQAGDITLEEVAEAAATASNVLGTAGQIGSAFGGGGLGSSMLKGLAAHTAQDLITNATTLEYGRCLFEEVLGIRETDAVPTAPAAPAPTTSE